MIDAIFAALDRPGDCPLDEIFFGVVILTFVIAYLTSPKEK